MNKQPQKIKHSKIVTTSKNDDKKILDIKINQNRSHELGSNDNDFIDNTLKQLLFASCSDGKTSTIDGVFAAFAGIKPQDELEAMLASQMVAVHNISMEMTKRALLKDQTVEGTNSNINRINKLMVTFTKQIEALQKYRTKGNQKITVQHVQVNNGGKAVIGDVNQGGGNE